MATMLRVMLLFLEQKKSTTLLQTCTCYFNDKTIRVSDAPETKNCLFRNGYYELDPHLDIKGIHLTLAAN